MNWIDVRLAVLYHLFPETYPSRSCSKVESLCSPRPRPIHTRSCADKPRYIRGFKWPYDCPQPNTKQFNRLAIRCASVPFSQASSDHFRYRLPNPTPHRGCLRPLSYGHQRREACWQRLPVVPRQTDIYNSALIIIEKSKSVLSSNTQANATSRI